MFQMETVDRLKSEKEDLEQEMRDLSTRNELLRANNEVQGSSLAASDVDIDDGGDGGNYYAMYEEMKSSYDRLLGQKEKLGREYHAAIEELVRKKYLPKGLYCSPGGSTGPGCNWLLPCFVEA